MFRIISITGRGVADRELTTVKAVGSDYEYVTNREDKSREIDVYIEIRDKNPSEMRKRIDDVSAFFSWEGYKPVVFSDEPDMTYLAEYEGYEEELEYHHIGIHRGVIKLLVQPHKSKDEKELSLQDATIVDNNGDVPTAPIIELTALQPTTYAMIENGIGEYNLIGFPLDEEGNEQAVDEKVRVLYEDGSTIDSWSTTTNYVDTNFNDVRGVMTSDGSGIRAQTYGTGTKMHGPAITKELPRSLTDFEIVTNIDIVSNREADNFRVELYFVDENLKMLGKIGIKDNSRAFKRRYGLGRVGNYRGKGRANGYAIGGHNYSRDITATTTLFNLWVRREGNLYTFYIGRWRSNRHEWVAKETYLDANGQFNGKLRYITLFVGNYKDRTVPSRLRFNNVEVFELRQLTVDQTPYILRAGDVVTFDHENEDILINGEDVMFLKHFGGEFWRLPKGMNNVILSPPGAFTGTMKYREKQK